MRPPKPFEDAAPSTQAWWGCHGLVYFLGVGEPLLAIKIGMLAVTKGNELPSALRKRLESIQSSNHELVYVIGLVHFAEGKHPTRDAEELERALHIEFKHLARFKPNTRGAEWFNPGTDLVARISSLAQPHTAFNVPRTVGSLIASLQNVAP